MKLSLVFENSGDCIDFDVLYNHEILELLVANSNDKNCNYYSDDSVIFNQVSKGLNELHNAVTLTNSIMPVLTNKKFDEHNDLLQYLDQKFLNRQHEQWVLSQKITVDIDKLRFSDNSRISKIGWRLHDLYPDEIRKIKLAEAMTQLGYIFPYEEVNMTVHRLEQFFANKIEFKSANKWDVFENTFLDRMVTNNDKVNFALGYTYVGRQYIDKWQCWDTDLEFVDHYNYELLEFAFQINLDRPQTIAFSPEFLSWCADKQVPPIARQVPIANVIDLEKNLKYYRTMLYTNSKAGNRATLKIN